MTVDLSAMFPDFKSADGEVLLGGRVVVRLHSGGSFATLVIALDRVADALERLRREQELGR